LASWLWLLFKIGELALAGFQNWRVGSGCFSKSASWLWPAFKTSEMALAGFQKLLAQLREIFDPIGAKDLNSPVLKSFSQIQKVFVLNGKELLIQYKIKRTVKKIRNICRSFSLPRPIKPYNFNAIIISCPSPFNFIYIPHGWCYFNSAQISLDSPFKVGINGHESFDLTLSLTGGGLLAPHFLKGL
jgi:hypothetical protein